MPGFTPSPYRLPYMLNTEGMWTIASVTQQLAERLALLLSNGTLTGPSIEVVKLTASASLNFPSITAGRTADLTVAVPGAVAGDTVILGAPSTLNAGLVFSGHVSAADVVTVRVGNLTAAAIDPAAATWNVIVLA